jgi:hypothetical protein
MMYSAVHTIGKRKPGGDRGGISKDWYREDDAAVRPDRVPTTRHPTTDRTSIAMLLRDILDVMDANIIDGGISDSHMRLDSCSNDVFF